MRTQFLAFIIGEYYFYLCHNCLFYWVTGSARKIYSNKSFASGLAGYWGYYERLGVVYEELCARHTQAVVAALAYGWQLERQATNNKTYGVRQRLQAAAQAAYEAAARLVPGTASAPQQAVTEALNAEVRSSSLIENVNSALRPLLETCRGQVRQETLDLFAFVHNHDALSEASVRAAHRWKS